MDVIRAGDSAALQLVPTIGVTRRGCGGSIAQAKKMTATPMAAVTSPHRALRMIATRRRRAAMRVT